MIGTLPVISGAQLTPKNQRLQSSLEHRLNRWFQETANAINEAIAKKYRLDQPLSTRKADHHDDVDGTDPDGEPLQTELLVGGKKIPKWQSDLIRAIALMGWGAVRWDQLAQFTQNYLQDAGEEGADVGIGQVQTTNASRVQDDAQTSVAEYAANRSAEMAGMKRDAEGALTPVDDAHWNLTDVMWRDLQASVAQAVVEGWALSQLAAVIEASYAFSSERAAIVANTELTNAQSHGTYAVWKFSKTVTMVQWTTSDLEREPDECDDYEARGPVPLGTEFAPGLFSPRAHPFCQCNLEVVYPGATP